MVILKLIYKAFKRTPKVSNIFMSAVKTIFICFPLQGHLKYKEK